jgi:hypothetical protein
MTTDPRISPPRRTPLRNWRGLSTVLALVSLGMAFSSAHAQSACTVGYTIANQWQGGFQAALTIGNTGTTAISNWTLTWSFANGQTVTQLWNGNETQSGGNVTVANVAFNGSIPAGGSVTGIGFTGSWNNVTNAVPTAFSLNGVACNGAASGGGSGGGGGGGGTGGSPPPALQIAWVSPASGVAGSSMTIMPGVGNTFGGSQGTSTVLFGTTRATVTTWTVNSVTVTVPNVPAGQVNVTAVVNGVTSNAVPFTVTSTTPSPVVFTGNSTWFTALGSPYGGCGVPQANLDSQNFSALNVQNDPGNYPLQLSRPISQQFANDIGLWNNGLNCGRWVHVVMGANCQGTNDGGQNEAFCRGGAGWVNDGFTGASLDMIVADSCQDPNAWCRDDPYHIDQAQAALNKYVLNGKPVGNLFPNSWNNRQVSWSFEPAPNYTGDINIAFIQGANAFWSAISITHLANGIHGIDYMQNGVWTAAVMDADLGEDYIVLPTVSGGTQYQIRVHDVTDQLINAGRIYSFSFPTSCGSSCSSAYTPITYTASAPAQ